MGGTSRSTGLITSTSTVVDGRSILEGINLAASAAGDLIVYDNTAASGDILFKATLAGTESPQTFDTEHVRAKTGIHVVVPAGAEVVIYLG